MVIVAKLILVLYLSNIYFAQAQCSKSGSDSDDGCVADELWNATFADIGFPHQMSYSPLFDVYLIGNAKHGEPTNVAGVYVVPNNANKNELESYLLFENDFGHGFGIF